MKKLWVQLSLTNGVISLVVVLVLVSAILGFRFIELTTTDADRPGPPQAQPPPAPRPGPAQPQVRPPPRGPAEWPLFVGLMLAAVAVGVLGGVAASRTISSPISKLARATREISARNLSVRAPVEGSEEIATLARSFNDMAGRLEASDDNRKRMLADISHELRTPLTVLKGHLRAQLDGVYQLSEADTANLYGQVEHLIHLVEDLRLLTLAESGSMPLTMAEGDIRILAQDCVELFEPNASEKRVHLSLGSFEHVSRVNMDALRVRQVLTNLTANALQYTQEGGMVTISGEPTPTHVKVSVRDTGQGIPPDVLPYVFDRFYRADGSRNRNTGGTGLGLAIVKAMVEAQGGAVGAESTHGSGSLFWFTLQVAAAQPRAHEFDTKRP